MKFDRSLILCNGMPEYLYAKSLQMGLPRHMQNSVSVVQDIHNANDSIALMKRAIQINRKSIKEKDPYKKVWVLLNRPDLSDTKVKATLEDNNFNAAYCPVCIEQWYMLHFEEYDPKIRCIQHAQSRLLSLWPQYRQNGFDTYEKLIERVPMAMQRAELARDSIYEERQDDAPVFTIHRLLTFFSTLSEVA